MNLRPAQKDILVSWIVFGSIMLMSGLFLNLVDGPRWLLVIFWVIALIADSLRPHETHPDVDYQFMSTIPTYFVAGVATIVAQFFLPLLVVLALAFGMAAPIYELIQNEREHRRMVRWINRNHGSVAI